MSYRSAALLTLFCRSLAIAADETPTQLGAAVAIVIRPSIPNL